MKQTLIGSCGFKGKLVDGKVEVGYEITEVYRSNGYATEILNLLTFIMFESEGEWGVYR